MIPKNFELIERLKSDEAAGTVYYKDRRMVILAADALGLFRKHLIEKIGFIQAAAILWKFGYARGYRDAINLKSFQKSFQKPADLESWFKTGADLLAAQGFVKMNFDLINLDKQHGIFEIECEWLNSYEAAQHLIHFGKGNDSICWVLTGYMSGFGTAVMERDVCFVELKCAARGDDCCAVVGRLELTERSEEMQMVEAALERHNIDFLTVSQTFGEDRAYLRRLIDTLTAQQDKVRTLESQVFSLQETRCEENNPREIIGESPKFKKALKNAEIVATSDSTVLLAGETGTGKELFACYIHSHSPRRHQPLIIVNCAALPAGLVESELFGHEKGAFTGAVQRRAGKFEIAGGGTIFLDEIGELPLEAQTKFLRVLQENEFNRVGGTKTLKTDVRVIAATNQNLRQLVDEGKFRADLFYRLNVFPITIPPLRGRDGDIISLANYFAQKYNRRLRKNINSITRESLELLENYDFPGNVRELEHLVERAVLLAEGEVLTIDLPLVKLAAVRGETIAPPAKLVSLEEMEREYIKRVLRQTKGQIAGKGGAAEILKLPASTLRSRMKKLGINYPLKTAA